MKTVWLDTETTSEVPGAEGRICQLAYLAEDGALRLKNFYFEAGALSESSRRVTGLTEEALLVLSGGKRFSDHAREIAADLAGARLVAHRFRFDFWFLEYEFSQCGVPFRYREDLCTAKAFGRALKLPREGGGRRRPRLPELCAVLGIADEAIAGLAARFGGPPPRGWHDARFDAAAAYLVTKKGEEMGILSGRLT